MGADDQSGLVTEESAGDEHDIKPPEPTIPELLPNDRSKTSILKLVPFLLLMIGYWSVYGQLTTTFQNQGCQMDRNVGSIEIPVAALQAFDTMAVLVLVPVFDQLVYPLFRKVGRPLSTLQRIAAGFAVALGAMLVAAVVESYRRAHAPSAVYYTEWTAENGRGVVLSPCQSVNDYNPDRYHLWVIAAEGGGAGGGDGRGDGRGDGGSSTSSHISKPTSCSHVPINGSCANYRFYSTPGTSLRNGTASGSCLLISCQPLPQVSAMSVMWQIPQFFLIGGSEVLSSIASLEFFYSQASRRNRGLVQSLNLLTNALGSFVIIPLVLAVNSKRGDEWLPQNIDTGHLDWFFLVLAGVMGASLVAFIYAAKGYRYVDVDGENERRRIDSADDIDDRHVEHRRRESEVELMVVPSATSHNQDQDPDQSQGQGQCRGRDQDQDHDHEEAANPMLGLQQTRSTSGSVLLS